MTKRVFFGLLCRQQLLSIDHPEVGLEIDGSLRALSFRFYGDFSFILPVVVANSEPGSTAAGTMCNRKRFSATGK